MDSGLRFANGIKGGNIGVRSLPPGKVLVSVLTSDGELQFRLTKSETRLFSSALMGAAAEAE